MSNEGRRWLDGMVKCWPVISPTIQETICKSQHAFIVVTYGGFVCIFSCLYINTDFFYNSAYLFVFLLAEFSLAFCSLCFTFEHHDP